MKASKLPNNQILYLATYPPRECGIATFTSDLTSAMDGKFNPLAKTRVMAINENQTDIYNYGKRVAGQIVASDIASYVALAQKINKSKNVKLVNIQHEFGLFGGKWGDHLIPFLQVIEKPVVTTFHSILPDPDEHLENVVSTIVNESKAVVVMNELSQKILIDDYGVPKSKIYLIPHGITPTTFEPSEKPKTDLGLSGKIVLSTFGLISPGKGIEYAIRALPTIIKKFPNVVYLILGETHPVIRKKEGEEYRNFLNREVTRLGLKDHVKFYNKYLTLEEKITYLKATDLYLSPTLGVMQSVSGTISDALGCGRPVISTKTAYAKYIINKRNGALVKFKNSKDIARAAIFILSDEKLLKKMSSNAYAMTRKMTWPNVAAALFSLYRKIANIDAEEKKMPEIKMDHLVRMTDDFGMLQHSKYSRPEKRYGYASDDNARAIIVVANYYQANPKPEFLNLIKTYLNFLSYAQKSNGSFVTIVDSKRRRDRNVDDDVQGRAIGAIGYLISQDSIPEKTRRQGEIIFKKALRYLPKLKAPRAVAFAMKGLYFYLKHSHNRHLSGLFEKYANSLVELYKNCAGSNWQWFENQLTYSNSKLSEALFYAYDLTKNKKYLEVAEKTLKFLSQITFEKEHYSPIGQNGWFFRNKNRAYFDQQPEDTASMVETKVLAYKLTRQKKYLEDAFSAFQWFLGKNHLSLMVYDEVTGGCHDGLGQYSLNLDQGAESTICYLLARLAIEEVKNELI